MLWQFTFTPFGQTTFCREAFPETTFGWQNIVPVILSKVDKSATLRTASPKCLSVKCFSTKRRGAIWPLVDRMTNKLLSRRNGNKTFFALTDGAKKLVRLSLIKFSKSAYLSLKDRLHWRTLSDNARDNTGDSDTYFTCLGHLG